jgi:DNA topoisomerase IB
VAQKKPVRSLDSLATLLSDSQKEEFKLEEEKRDKQLKKSLEVIKAIQPGLLKKKVSEKEFTKMYDSLKQSKAEFLSGTDKDGDYIIREKVKYIRTEDIKVA